MPPPMSMTATPISFSSSDRTASAGERFEHDVGHAEPAALDAADDVLHAAGRRGDEVHSHLQAYAAHADGIAYAVLVVDDVFARQDVEDLAVGVDRYRARPFEDALEVDAGHFATRDRRDSIGRLRANVATGHARVHGADLDARHRLRRVDGVPDRAHRPVDVRYDALAKPAARHVADAENRDAVRVDLAYNRRHLGRADVETHDDLRTVQAPFHFADLIRPVDAAMGLPYWPSFRWIFISSSRRPARGARRCPETRPTPGHAGRRAVRTRLACSRFAGRAPCRDEGRQRPCRPRGLTPRRPRGELPDGEDRLPPGAVVEGQSRAFDRRPRRRGRSRCRPSAYR